MARTTAVPEASDTSFSGATILPGVPMPAWGPAEPVLPDPPPAPPAPPAPAVAAAPPPPPVEAPVPLPAPVELAAPVGPPVEVPLDAPPAEVEVRRPRSHRRDAAAPAAAAAVMTLDAESATDQLDAPIPQLAPPTPVPPRAEVYAAAGAAPPTAPWGTPPAELPVATTVVEPVEPVDVAADDPAPVTVEDDPDHDGSAGQRPRSALVMLGAFLAILVLGAVAAFVWPGFLVAEDEPAVASPRPAVSAATKVSLAAPESVAGLTLLAGAPAAALTKAAEGTTLAGYTAPVTAVYGTGTTPAATVIAWNATTRGAGADVSTAFAGYQQATGQPVTAITSVPTGKLGGRMSCGSGVVGTTPASVCFWADDATFGAVTVLRPTDAKAGAATAVAIRTAMETRS